jgi:hypothetical protein
VALAVEDGRRGWFAGWTWGFGHASGVVVVALLAIVVRDLLPPVDILSAWGERVVGIALIAIGLWALRRGLNISPSGDHHGAIAHDRAGAGRTDVGAASRPCARVVLHGDPPRRHRRHAPPRHAADRGDAGDRGGCVLVDLEVFHRYLME